MSILILKAKLKLILMSILVLQLILLLISIFVLSLILILGLISSHGAFCSPPYGVLYAKNASRRLGAVCGSFFVRSGVFACDRSLAPCVRACVRAFMRSCGIRLATKWQDYIMTCVFGTTSPEHVAESLSGGRPCVVEYVWPQNGKIT